MASDDHTDDHQIILSNLNKCSGSAMYTFGDNIVQCSLFGPQALSTSQNLLKKNTFIILLYRLGQIKNSTKDKSLFYYEFYFKMTIIPMIYDSMLPRSRTYLVLNELEQGSAFISTSLNALTLALIDSGYPLNYCIGTCGLTLDQRSQRIMLENEFRENCSQNIRRAIQPLVFTFETCDFIKAKFYITNRNSDSKTISILAEGKFSLTNVFDAQEKSKKWNQSFFESISNKISERFV